MTKAEYRLHQLRKCKYILSIIPSLLKADMVMELWYFNLKQGVPSKPFTTEVYKQSHTWVHSLNTQKHLQSGNYMPREEIRFFKVQHSTVQQEYNLNHM